MCAHSAVAPLVPDQMWVTVSSVHGRPVPGSATPPHRSTTVSPSTVTQTDAPTSPRPVKLRVNSSRTWSNSGAQLPWVSMGRSQHRPAQPVQLGLPN